VSGAATSKRTAPQPHPPVRGSSGSMPRTLSPAYDAPPTEKERAVSEVVVVVTLQCKAGREQEMRQTLTGGAAATHEEDGCVVYA
jgi:hypothetical protein